MRQPGKNPEDPLRVCERLEKKLDLLKNFYSATASIKKCFDSGDVEHIDSLIYEREKCMDTIDRLDACLLESHSGNPTHFSSLPAKTKALIESMNGGIEKTLGEISALDKECNMVAASRFNILQQELLTVNRDRQGLQGYRDNKSQAPRFLNMKL